MGYTTLCTTNFFLKIYNLCETFVKENITFEGYFVNEIFTLWANL